MQNSGFQQYAVPGALTNGPLAIAQASEVPMRVVVRNIGAVALFLTGASTDALTPEGPSSKTFLLAAGSADLTVVLAPKQKLYCAGATPGGRATVHWNEALPLV